MVIGVAKSSDDDGTEAGTGTQRDSALSVPGPRAACRGTVREFPWLCHSTGRIRRARASGRRNLVCPLGPCERSRTALAKFLPHD